MKKMSEYKYHIGLKMRAYGSYKVKTQIRQFGGSANFVYNRLVSINQRLHQLRKVHVYLEPVAQEIEKLEALRDPRNLMNAAPFLHDVDSSLVHNAKQNYSKAWKNHQRNGGLPTYHKKSNVYRYQTNPHYNSKSVGMNDCSGFYFIDKKHVMLPKIGKVRVKGSKKIIDKLFGRTAETRLGTVTVTLDATGRIYISVQLASDELFVDMYEKTGSISSFDLNISNFLTEYDGNVIENPRYLKNAEEHLKRLQKKLSKKALIAKKKGRELKDCKEYQKLRKQIAELHIHVANQRRNFHHETASTMLKSHDIVFAEDLKVKNMLKNRKLSKAISDVGWGQFLDIMTQKAEMRGKSFIKVAPQNTTQTCSSCGHVMKGDDRIPLGQEEWICPHCGAFHVRDHNSAVNIMNKGLELLS